LKGDSPSADFCLVTDKIMPDNPYIHPMWTGSESADIFSVILHRNPLTYDSMPAEFLYNLTKKSVGASSAQALCGVALTGGAIYIILHFHDKVKSYFQVYHCMRLI